MIPPATVVTLGISWIPKIGRYTQRIPPTASTSDNNNVSSAAGKNLALIENKIKPNPTIKPCSMLRYTLRSGIASVSLRKNSISKVNSIQSTPARAIVANCGVCLRHRRLTEKTAKPNAATQGEADCPKSCRPPIPPGPLRVYPKAR